MDNFIQITVFCPPEPRLDAFVYRNAGKVRERKSGMNNFPVIGDVSFEQRIVGSPGGKHCKSL